MGGRTGWRVVVAVTMVVGTTVVALPVERPVSAAPPGFVTVDGDGLVLDGEPYTFTGINVYNANNTGGCWNALSDTVLGQSFDAIGGERVVRAWFFQSLATTGGVRDWTAFDRTLAFASVRGMKVIPTLGNQWGACDGPTGGPGVDKDEAWYTSGYSSAVSAGSVVSYRDWAAEIVARYADDPTILAWQLMNEAEVKPVVGDNLPCSTNAATILRDFAADVSTLVKSIDPDHLVSLGTIGGGQCGTSFEEYAFVHDLPTIDVCEYHDYGPPTAAFAGDQYNGLAKRVAQCDALDKPLIIGESGIRPSDVDETLVGRAWAFRAKLKAQLAAGIDGVALWAWNPAGSTLADYDIGPGDPTLAVLSDVLSPSTPPEGLFTPELLYAPGFSDGVATDIGLHPRDLAWDTAGDRLLVADCEVLRAVDPVANTSTVIAIAADLPNPTSVATFVGRVYEVAARGDGTVLLGLTGPGNGYAGAPCSVLYWDRVARLVPWGPAVAISGGSVPAAAGVPAADAQWTMANELVTSDDGSIFVWSDAPVQQFHEGGQLVLGPEGLASPAGDIYRIDGSELFIVDPAGVERMVPLQSPPPVLSFPSAITFGGDGALWMVVGTRVVRIDVVSGEVDDVGDIASIGGRDASYWATIAVSPDGVAYTTSEDWGYEYGRVMSVSVGSPVTVAAGTSDRWQGEGRPADRQMFNLFHTQGLHGRSPVGADSDGNLHVFGSRLATIDGGTGLTSTDPEPEAFWVGQRPNGDEVLSVPAGPDELGPRRLAVRDAVTGALAPLLPDPLDPLGDPYVDVAPDGTVYVASFYGLQELTTIAVDGTVTTEPLGDRPTDEFGNPADAWTIWATATGLFAHLSTGLARRVGGDWIDAGTCAGGDGPFSPAVALRDGRFLGTVPVGVGYQWCRVDPSTGVGTLLPDAMGGPPSYTRESADGYVYYRDMSGFYRMRVTDTAPATSTITLALATDPAGAADVFTAAGAIAGAISHGQQLTVTVPAGTSTVSVTGPSGWASTGVVCDDSDSSAGAVNGEVVFRTAPGDTVRCTLVMARTDADLSITKTADQASVVSGGTLVYTLTATNAGPGVATDVVLLDALPGGVTFADAGPGCTHDGQAAGGDVICSVGDVATGESVTRTVQVVAGPPGVVANSAGAATASTDSDPADNGSATVFTDVLPADANPCQTGPGNELWAFGDNGRGELGSLVPGSISNPVPVNLLRDVVQVDGGGGMTLALLADRTVCSWGSTWPGGLGRPPGPPSPGFDASVRPTPRPVLDTAGMPLRADRVIAASGSNGYAIVDPDGDGVGTLMGWGSNEYGQVTPGSPSFFPVPVATPVPLPGGTAVRDISSGGYVVAAIAADHRVLTWGYDDGGNIGPYPGNQTREAPSDLTPYLTLLPGERPERVFVLAHRIVVLTDHGRGLCFAPNPVSAGATCNDTIPVIFDTDATVLAADGGSNGYAVALLLDDNAGGGEVHVWGDHYGDGTPSNVTRVDLVRAQVPEPVTAVSVAASHVLAIGQSGQVWGWGNPWQGSLDSGGFGGEVLFPVPLGMAGADLIEASYSGSFVRGTPTNLAERFESMDRRLARGATDGTDTETDGATSADRVETTITNSSSLTLLGRLEARVTEGPVDPAIAPNLPGYRAMGEMVTILGYPDGGAPPPATDPYLVQFALYLTPAQRAAQTTFGGFVENLAVLRNNVPVPTCSTTAAPHPEDPCVRSRTFDPATGNAVIVVATTRFSTWTFAVPAPTADAGGPYTAIEGTPLPLNGSVSDAPLGTTVEWTSTIEAITFDDATQPDTTVTAPDDGSVFLEFSAFAADESSTDLVGLTVVNAQPTITDVSAPIETFAGVPVELTTAFADAGQFDTHSIVIDWGDGTAITELESAEPGGATITAQHTYAAAGSFSVDVTVTDDDGGTATSQIQIAVVDPDQRILFSSARSGGGDIYVMDADGTNVTRLTTHARADTSPSWSPDGTRVLFASARSGAGDIYVMDADGANVTRLTTHARADTSPSWSPDGTRVLFASARTGSGDIYVMDADGTDVVRLTSHSSADASPSWSPDGTRIAISSKRSGGGDIYAMDADGTDVTRLTTQARADTSPSWSPDGTRVVFASARSGSGDIYVMDADGSDVVRLTSHASADTSPSW